MTATPAHILSTVISTKTSGEVLVGPPTSSLVSVLAPFYAGSVENTFETVSKNLKAYPYSLGYGQSGQLSTITYTTPIGSIIKTFNYDGGKLVSISLSGSGVPTGIRTVKTPVYSGDKIIDWLYS